MEFTANQIAQFLKGEIVGNPETVVSGFSKIEEAEEGSLTFLANGKYEKHLYTTKASIALVNKDFTPKEELSTTLIKVENAYESLASLLTLYDSAKPKKKGISSKAEIEETANLGEDLFIGAFSYVGENVNIGDGSRIHQNCNIADNVTIGENVLIYPGVTIYEGCKIGNNCILHAGVIIGSDGFGFAQQTDENYKKIPQIGIVILKDNVEVGANSTIDRATMGTTVIYEGVKIDNLVQIAHNVEVGKNSVLCAQVGIAGSAKIGDKCILAGQVGVVGHLSISNNTVIGAQSGVANTVKKEGTVLLGSPATPFMDQKKSYAVYKNLPAINKNLYQLEREVKELKEQLQKKNDNE